ncbi:hypothetical protein AB0H42_05165 [Nocardia sp. NPDC050799]|uniref:hypothetical protein n=1 Tax=Nocardia sp. NPDC050799 TaxID=3154842 RepID=UPI0033D8F233
MVLIRQFDVAWTDEGIAVRHAAVLIQEAIQRLEKVGDVKKAAGSIQRNAAKIEQSCTAITTGIERLLAEALTALTASAAGPAPLLHIHGGVA